MTIQQKRDRVAELAPLAEEHRKITNELSDAALDEAAAKLAGRFFKYPGNTYGGDATRKTWPVYRAMLSVSNGNEITCLEIQDDRQGRIKINTTAHFVLNLHYPQGSGYHEITRAEYMRAQNGIESAANKALVLTLGGRRLDGK